MIVAGGVDADQALSSTELFEYNRPGATWISATNLPGDPFCIKNFIATAALLVCKPLVSFSVQNTCMAFFFCHKLFLIERLQIMMFTHTGSTSQSQRFSSNLGISWRPTWWTIPSCWRICPCCQVLPGFNSCMESCLAGNFYF